MNTRQIPFYCRDNDYPAINSYLDKCGIHISALPLTGNCLRPIPMIKEDENTDEWKRVILFQKEEDVIIDKIDCSPCSDGVKYFPNATFSNLIEFDKCYINHKSKEIIGGKICYTARYYNDNKLVQKSDSFLSWANDFFKWIKKTYIPIKQDGRNFYITTEIENLLKNGYSIKQ